MSVTEAASEAPSGSGTGSMSFDPSSGANPLEADSGPSTSGSSSSSSFTPRTEDTKLLGRMLRSDLAAEVSVYSPAALTTCLHTRLDIMLIHQSSTICCKSQMAAVGLFKGRRLVAAGSRPDLDYFKV